MEISVAFARRIRRAAVRSCVSADEENGRSSSDGAAYPPFEMTDTAGKLTGVSVDLANALGKSLERPVVIQKYGVRRADSGLLEDGQGRSGDFVDDGTGKRAVDRLFRPVHIDRVCASCSRRIRRRKAIADLDKEGVKVAVKKGTTGHL